MMKHQPKPGFTSLFLLILLLTACTPAADTPGASTPVADTPGATTPATPMAGTGEPDPAMDTPAGDETGASTEIDELFINMMVPHHEGAVAMARIAQERTQRPEIRILADAIMATQVQEITQMKAWKQEWYGSSDTPDMSEMPTLEEMPGMGGMGHTMDMQADVDALQNAPEPFDLAFIDAMIPHHQSAIDAAKIALQEAVHPEIRELAQGIIKAQQQEIDRMLEWRAAWFPDAPPL